MAKVLVIGSGGREHALAWKLSQSPEVEKIYAAPGNAGTAMVGENVDIKANDINSLADFAQKNSIDLTVVGPEDPLVNGIVDEFEKRNLPIFGPNQKAAMLEGSKSFAKYIMEKYGVPTGKAKEFTNSDEAIAYVKQEKLPIVVKADGLAAGKGVTVCKTLDEAINAIKTAMVDKKFGDSGNKVLIEECLVGEEASILAISDGKDFVLLDSSQDHKPVFDEDKGPNTGGMGAYSPAPVVTHILENEIKNNVIKKTLEGMAKEGAPFKGVLYAGLMITDEGPKVLEFNVRFGDPEIQAIFPRLRSDLYEIMKLAVNGKIRKAELEWSTEPACCVVLASGGYPGSYEKGKEISGLDQVKNTDKEQVFMAGVKLTDGKFFTSGGRVLNLVAQGNTIEKAIENTYQLIPKVSFEKVYYRKDIGKKALKYSEGFKKYDKLNLAVLASTRGTDLQALIDESKAGRLENVNIAVVVSNVEKAGALDKARNNGIEAVYISQKGKTREDYDREVMKVLEKYNIDLIFLIGYMRWLSKPLIKRYWNKIMNVHPSLLPSFVGMDRSVHKDILEYGCKVSGCTVFFIDESEDAGPIILQKAVKVEEEDDIDALKAKIQAEEKKIVPEAVRLFRDGKLSIIGRRIKVLGD